MALCPSYWPSVGCSATPLRACYAMPGTDIAYAATHMLCGGRYAVCGSGVAYAATVLSSRMMLRY
eukprot:1073852-Rhodomonas_salina.1